MKTEFKAFDGKQEVKDDGPDSGQLQPEEEDDEEYHGTKFGYPLHLACGSGKLVSAHSFLQFKDDFVNVTNGDLVIHINMHDLNFPQDMIDNMNGYYLHKEAFKHIFNKDIEYYDGVLASVDGIEAPLIDSAKFHHLINPGEEAVTANKYPDIKDYLANVGSEHALKVVGLSGDSAKVFFDIFKRKHMHLTFAVATADSYKLKVQFLGWNTGSIAFFNPFLLID